MLMILTELRRIFVSVRREVGLSDLLDSGGADPFSKRASRCQQVRDGMICSKRIVWTDSGAFDHNPKSSAVIVKVLCRNELGTTSPRCKSYRNVM